MKTLVVGATPNPSRYAYEATNSLLKNGHEVFLYGIKKGDVFGIPIKNTFPNESIDTVTLYVGPRHQPDLYQSIIDLKPRRVIFNPGTENMEFQDELIINGIEVEEACTLVLLSIGNY